MLLENDYCLLCTASGAAVPFAAQRIARTSYVFQTLYVKEILSIQIGDITETYFKTWQSTGRAQAVFRAGRFALLHCTLQRYFHKKKQYILNVGPAIEMI
jgi:hypothetical protein